MKILILILILFPTLLYSQKLLSYRGNTLGVHVYPIKLKYENKSFWVSLHNYTKDLNPLGGYIDLKFSLRVKEKQVIYYNIYIRNYINNNKFGVFGQLRIKI